MPAVTLDATLSGETSNSYVTTDYADAYWADHWDVNSASQWAGLNDNQKAQLLVQSCRSIEALRFTEPVDYTAGYHLVMDSRNQSIRSVKTNFGRAEKYFYEQKLQFPRTVEELMSGQTYVPEEIMFAQCEQAVYQMNLDTTVLANRIQGISHDSINVGGVSISQKLEAKGSMLSPVAYNYCKPFLIKKSIHLARS